MLLYTYKRINDRRLYFTLNMAGKPVFGIGFEAVRKSEIQFQDSFEFQQNDKEIQSFRYETKYEVFPLLVTTISLK